MSNGVETKLYYGGGLTTLGGAPDPELVATANRHNAMLQDWANIDGAENVDPDPERMRNAVRHAAFDAAIDDHDGLLPADRLRRDYDLSRGAISQPAQASWWRRFIDFIIEGLRDE